MKPCKSCWCYNDKIVVYFRYKIRLKEFKLITVKREGPRVGSVV